MEITKASHGISKREDPEGRFFGKNVEGGLQP